MLALPCCPDGKIPDRAAEFPLFYRRIEGGSCSGCLAQKMCVLLGQRLARHFAVEGTVGVRRSLPGEKARPIKAVCIIAQAGGGREEEQKDFERGR